MMTRVIHAEWNVRACSDYFQSTILEQQGVIVNAKVIGQIVLLLVAIIAIAQGMFVAVDPFEAGKSISGFYQGGTSIGDGGNSIIVSKHFVSMMMERTRCLT